MTKLSMGAVTQAAGTLARKMVQLGVGGRALWGIPRGGVPAAMALCAACNRLAMADIYHVVDDVADAELIVDDLADSGATREKYHKQYQGPVAVLFTKREEKDIIEGWKLYGTAIPANQWVVFPWEGGETGSANDIVIRLLQLIGEDPNRAGLVETPARVIKAWGEWCAGYKVEPAEVLKSFEDGAEGVDEMVLVRDIPIYSHCEHHLAPFFGVAHIAYIPNGRIAGLSKLIRLAEVFSRRLQVQERMTNQIADALVEHLKAKGVGVVVECRHLCMESRGVSKAGATTVTSAMRGAMLEKPAARSELMSLIRARS